MEPCSAKVVASVCHEQARRLARALREIYRGRDPEAVHAARVACRRVGVALGIAKAHCPVSGVAKTRRRVKKFLKLLSTTRDAEVLAERVGRISTVEAAEIHQGLAFECVLAHLRSAAAVRRTGFDRLPAKIERVARRLRACGPSPPLRQVAAGVLGQHVSKVLQLSNRARPGGAARRLHRLRLAYKKLRYAAEFFEPILREPATALARTARAFQTVLGEFQDACVFEESLRQFLDDRVPKSNGEGAYARIQCGMKDILAEIQADKRRLRKDIRRRWDRGSSGSLNRLVRCLRPIARSQNVGQSA